MKKEITRKLNGLKRRSKKSVNKSKSLIELFRSFGFLFCVMFSFVYQKKYKKLSTEHSKYIKIEIERERERDLYGCQGIKNKSLCSIFCVSTVSKP